MIRSLLYLLAGSLLPSIALCAAEAKARPPVVTVRQNGGTCVAIGLADETLRSDTNAAVVINAAIMEVARIGRGGTVLIAEGTYFIDSPVQMKTCVKLAGRNARIGDCFLERARKQAVWFTNGNQPAPVTYDGMTLADTLIHAGQATCLVVSRDPSAQGAVPANGTVINSRLKMGLVQAVYAGGIASLTTPGKSFRYDANSLRP